MSRARAFIQTDIVAIRQAAQNAALVPTSGNVEDEGVARVLRNGLAVIALASLERFVRERVSELSASLTTRTHLKFTELPEALQKRLAVSALSAMSSELERSPAPLSRIDSIVSLGKSLSSLESTRTVFSASAFHWAGSNLRIDDVQQALQAVGYKNVWRQLSEVISRVLTPGSGSDASAVFRGLLERRNSAAHDAAHTVSVLEVRTLHRDLLALAISLDTLFSDAVRCLIAGDLDGVSDMSRVAIICVNKPQRARKFRLVENTKRPKTFNAFEDAARFVANRETLSGRGALVLRHDSVGDVTDWRLTVDT